MAQPEFGVSAWGRAWLRTVERSTGPPNQGLPRARSLARNQHGALAIDGDTITTTIEAGAATHQVSIRVTRWTRAQQAAAEPVLAAGDPASVAGDLPDRLVDALTKAGAPVAVPLDELATTCTCRARSRPCAHILTALYRLVLLVDERPVVAVELRAGDLASEVTADAKWIALDTIRPEHFYTVTRH